MDRIAPTRRPDARPSGHQVWEKLLFVHYAFPAEVVRALVPPELDLDLWEDGQAWVGLVPFAMKGIRPAFIPFGIDFLETNLRTYVSRKDEPGVFFFSLEASSLLAVEAARFGWGLPYFHADMSLRAEGTRVHYASTRRGTAVPARSVVECRIGKALGPSAAGTLEHFLLERYYLFTVREGRVSKGHVHHAPYVAHEAELLSQPEGHEGLFCAAGLPAPVGPPSAVHYSAGVDVEVFGPWEEKADGA